MSIRSFDQSMPFPTLGDNAWQREAMHRLAAVFPMPKTTSHVARAVRQAPRVIDYFEQAPVLGVVGLSARSVAAMAAGGKLKRILRDAGVTGALRPLRGTAVVSVSAADLRKLSAVSPSVVAQSIPDDIGRQRDFLRNCSSIFDVDPKGRFSDDAFRAWAVQRVAPLPRNDACSILDFVGRSMRPISFQWTAAEAVEATARWHAELHKMSSEQRFFERNGVRFDEDISYDDFAVLATEGEYAFVALRSGAALYEDGRAMHHCVGSYSSDVITRKSRIYSVRRDEKRVATIEFRRSGKSAWAVAQICGPCNARVAPEIKLACDALAKKFGARPA